MGPSWRDSAKLGGLVVALGGCRAVLGIEDTEVVKVGDAGRLACAPDAAVLGSGWWSHCSETTGCYSVGLPTAEARPTTASSSGTDVPRFFLATREMHLGASNSRFELDPDAWRGVGLDLDGLCTASPTCTAAGTAAGACQPSGSDPTDGLYCLDNQVGRLDYLLDSSPGLASVGVASDVELNCGLCRGHYSFIYGITGYNGLPNDDAVRVDIYPSAGIVDEPADMSCADWPGSSDPVCTGADSVWTIARSAVDDPSTTGSDLGRSQYYDPAAYVRDGVLVVSLPDNTQFWFPSGDRGGRPVLPLTLHGAVLVGRLVAEDGAWRLVDGVLAGRTKQSDLLQSLRLVGVCEDHPAWLAASMFVATNADSLSTGAVAPDIPCDALSFGFSLRAEEARVGDLVDLPALEPCVTPGSDGGTS